MAKKKINKVDAKSAWLIILLTVVLAVLLVAALALRGLPGEEKTPGTTAASTAAPEQTTAPDAETTVPVETVTQGTINLIDQIDGTYEQWLAAGMVMVLPLEYPDFAQLEIYAPKQTALADKQESEGVYLRFTSGGEQVVLHAAPLEAERTEAGTRDMSTMQTGYATLDAVSGEGLDFTAMEQFTPESLSGHIAQVLLPSVYQR